MADKSVNFNTHCNLCESHLDSLAKWLSCNGEPWGIGPTAVFASAAALFLYNELKATIFVPGDQARVSFLEKTLISTMVLGMLALMTHLWVCSMRFFQYYLDTLIKDSPSMLLEMTTASLLGTQTSDIVPLGPLTRFLRQQQPQIHITFCWFLSLCYADYVRKHYCQRFNLPYLEQWLVLYLSFIVKAQEHVFKSDSGIPKRSSTNVCAVASKVSWSDGRGSGKDEDQAKEMCARIACTSSETTAAAIEKLRAYISLVQWAKCGDSLISTVPTMLWAVGAAALAQRLISSLFRRFVFRRVPLWELVLQNLLFIWMVIYSLHFWSVLVKVLRAVIEYSYEGDKSFLYNDDVDSCKAMQQWVIWMFGVAPLAIYIQTRPRPDPSPLMIWITTSPWQRREMGPYGYYLSRPLLSLQPSSTSPRQQVLAIRKAFSDSKIIVKEPPKKKRCSKSV